MDNLQNADIKQLKVRIQGFNIIITRIIYKNSCEYWYHVEHYSIARFAYGLTKADNNKYYGDEIPVHIIVRYIDFKALEQER